MLRLIPAGLACFSAMEIPDYRPPDSFAMGVALAEILGLALLGGLVAHGLGRAMRKSNSHRVREIPWLPVAAATVYGLLIAFVHFAAWVPVALAAVLALPCIVLPPLVYRVYQSGRSSSGEKPLFTREEACRAQDRAALSFPVRQFRERYPDAQIYLYRFKRRKSHSAGGLLLYNRESLNWPEPTYLDVILDCPFLKKAGVLAAGKESFQAYLIRPKGESQIVSPLPLMDWEEWTVGLKQSVWYSFLSDLDSHPPNYPAAGPLPYALHKSERLWAPVRLT